MGAAQPANHRGEQARTQPHEASLVHELSEEVPPTTISPNSPRETQATPTTSPTQESVQNSPTERVSHCRTPWSQCSTEVQTTEVQTTEVPTNEVQTTSSMGRDGLEQDGTNSHQSREKDGDQQQPITSTTGDTIAQQPHQGSTLEPMLPGPPQTNADDAESGNGRAAQGNGSESLDLDGMCWLDVAQRRQSQAISDEPRHHSYPHLLVDPVNAGNSGLIEVASKALEAQGPALVETLQNPESDARQVRDLCQATNAGRNPPNVRQATQPPEHNAWFHTIVLSTTSRDGHEHSGSLDSSHSANARSAQPPVLRPFPPNQTQRHNQKSLKAVNTPSNSRVPFGLPWMNGKATNSPNWRPVNRRAGESDWTESSSTIESPGQQMSFHHHGLYK